MADVSSVTIRRLGRTPDTLFSSRGLRTIGEPAGPAQTADTLDEDPEEPVSPPPSPVRRVGNASPVGDTGEPPLTLGDPREAKQEATGLRRRYAVNQRDQAVAAKQQADLDKRTRGAQREADFRSKGQKFYTDSFGELQPVLDEAGQPQFAESAWKKSEVPTGDGGKRWALTRRNERGETEVRAPKLVASDDLRDPNLYYDFGGMRGEREVAGHVDDLANSSDAEVAREAAAQRQKRNAAIRNESLKPLQEAHDAAAADLIGARLRQSHLDEQIGGLSQSISSIEASPAFNATKGGFLGIGSEPTEEAARLKAQHADLSQQLSTLQKQRSDLALATDPNDGLLAKKAAAAKLELDAWSHQSKVDELDDLATQRRVWLRAQNRPEKDDPVLAQITAKQTEFGEQLSKISQQRQAEADVIARGRAVGDAAEPDPQAFSTAADAFGKRVVDYSTRLDGFKAKAQRGATDDGLHAEALAIENDRRALLGERERLSAWSEKIGATRAKEAVAVVGDLERDRDSFKPDFFVGHWSKFFTGQESEARDERMAKLRSDAGAAFSDKKVSALATAEKMMNYVGAIVSTPIDAIRGRTLADVQAQERHDQAKQLIGDFKGADALKVVKLQGDYADRLARGEPIVRVKEASTGNAVRQFTTADSLESLQSLHDVLKADDGTSPMLGSLVGGREISRSVLQVASLINALPGVNVNFQTLGVNSRDPEAFAKHAVLARAVAEQIQGKYPNSALAGMVAGSLDQFIGMNAIASPLAARAAVTGKRTAAVAALGGVKMAAERASLWLASAGVGASQSYFENPSMSFSGRWVDVLGNTIPLAVGEATGNWLEHALTRHLPASLSGAKLVASTAARIGGGTAGEITSDIVQNLVQGQPFDDQLRGMVEGNLGAVLGMALIRGAGEAMPLKHARDYAARITSMRAELNNRLADVRAVIDEAKQQTPEGERARAILAAIPAGAVVNFEQVVGGLPATPVERAKDLGQLRAQNAQRLGRMLVAGTYAETLQHRIADTSAALAQIDRLSDYFQIDPQSGEPVTTPALAGANRDAARALVKAANGVTPERLTEGESKALGVIGEELGTEMFRIVDGKPVITDAARGWVTDLAPASGRLIRETESQRLADLTDRAAPQKAPVSETADENSANPAGADDVSVSDDLRDELAAQVHSTEVPADIQPSAATESPSVPVAEVSESREPLAGENSEAAGEPEQGQPSEEAYQRTFAASRAIANRPDVAMANLPAGDRGGDTPIPNLPHTQEELTAIRSAKEGDGGEPFTIQQFGAWAKRLSEGEMTADEVRSAWPRFKASRAAVVKELVGMNKDQLLRVAGMRARASDSKASLVRSVLDGMESEFVAGGGLSFGMGEGARERALEEQMSNWTDELIQKDAANRRERIAQRQKEITNPETLSEFDANVLHHGARGLTAEEKTRADKLRGGALREWVRDRGIAKLSPEQRAIYERLQAEAGRQTRQQGTARRKTVEAVALPVGSDFSDVIQTRHTQKGHDLFVVQMSKRVDRDVYDRLNDRAKRLGGSYSSYNKGGAVPGFQFRTRDAAEQFRSGERIAGEERLAAQQTDRRSRAAARLAELAQVQIQKGEEILSQDRKTNTARRADMAAGIEARARSQIALGETMHSLSRAIAANDVQFIDRINNGAQVEMLNRLLRGSQYSRIREQVRTGGLDGSHATEERERQKPLGMEDAAHAEYPWPSVEKSTLLRMVATGRDRAGAKLVAERVAKIADQFSDGWGKLDSAADVETVRSLAEKLDTAENKFGDAARVLAAFEDYDRLQKLDLRNEAELRTALREYAEYREGAANEDPIKKLERELVGANIPGFFPTPKALAQEVVRRAKIGPGMTVLEPSAGKGDLADEVRAAHPEAKIDVGEVSGTLRVLLNSKGYEPKFRDFLEQEPEQGTYDRIVMNPPFEKSQDIEHVRHAYSLLNPGGKLVAIMSEGPFFRGDRRANEFRGWLASVGGKSERNAEGAFAGSNAFRQTATNTRIVEIAKQAEPTAKLAPPQTFRETQRQLLQQIDAAIEGAPSEEDFLEQAQKEGVQEEIKGRLNRKNEAGRKAADAWVQGRARDLAAKSGPMSTITITSGNSRFTVTHTAETLARLRKAVEKRIASATLPEGGSESVPAAKVEAGFKAAKNEVERRAWMDMMTEAQLVKFGLNKNFVRVGPGQVVTREAAEALRKLNAGNDAGEFDIEASTPVRSSVRADLVRSHLALADRIAGRYNIPGLESSDVRQEARRLLIHAAQGFDSSRGDFGPYAGTVIRNRLRDLFNREVRRVRLQGVSADVPSETGGTLLDSLIVHDTARGLAERADTRRLLEETLKALPERAREILLARAHGATFSEIAAEHGVSDARVKQIARGAMETVRAQLTERGVHRLDDAVYASMAGESAGATIDAASPAAFTYVEPENDERAREDAAEVRSFEEQLNHQRGEGAAPVRLALRRLGSQLQSGQRSVGETSTGSARAHRALEVAFGKRILFVSPSGPVAWQAVTARRRANTILVNTSAPSAFTALVGHEFTHNLRNQTPDLFRAFRRVVREVAPMSQEYVTEKAAQGYASDAIETEWVADTLGARFDDPAFWGEVARVADRRGVAVDGSERSLNFRELMTGLMAWLDKMATRLKNLLHDGTGDVFVRDLQRLRRTAAEVLVEYQGRGPLPADTTALAFVNSPDAELSTPAPEGEKFDSEWTPFAPDSGSLGIPRAEMPQIKSEHRGALVQFLKGRGIEHAQDEVLPGTLKPTQAEFSPAKVEKARKFDGESRAILVSADGHVVDGHHQWMAALTDAPDRPIRVIRLNATVRELLLAIAQFPSVENASGGIANGRETKNERSESSLSKPAPVPGQPGNFYRSTPDSLREHGLKVARQIYTRRGHTEIAEVARAIVDAVGEERAAEIVLDRSDKGVPGDVQTMIYGDLLSRKARRLTDPKTSKADRAKAQREIQRLQAVKPAQFTERGQEISALQRVYQDVRAATMSEYVDGIRKAQDRRLGEPGAKAVTDAANAFNEAGEKAIAIATKALEKSLRTVPVTKAIWSQYRDHAAQRLFDLVDNAAKPAPDKVPLQEFTQRVIEEMRSRLTPHLPDKPESDQVSPAAADLLREAIDNREKYADVLTTVRRLFAEKYGDGSPALELVDTELAALGIEPYSKRLIDRAIKEAHAAMRVNVVDLARQHFTKTDPQAGDLADGIVAITGLKGTEATKLAADLTERTKELVADARRKALDKLRKQASATPKIRAVVDVIERAVELNNLGAMHESDMRDIVAKKLGLPSVSSEQMTLLAKLADRVETAGAHAARVRAELELASALRDVHGVGGMELATAVWYANLLSGFTTHAANAFGNFTNATLQLGSLIAANPKQGGDALRGWVSGFADGWTDAKSIMQRGYGRRDLDAKVGAASSALERVDYGRHFPNLNAKMAIGLNKHVAALRYVFRAMQAVDAIFYHAAKESYTRVAVAKLLEGEFTGRELADKIRETLQLAPHQFINAAHQAEIEGYAGIEKALRVGEIIDEKRRASHAGAAAAEPAERFALETTFNNEPVGWAGVLYYHLAALTNDLRPGGIPVLKAFLPFLRIPTNITNTSLNFTPWGTVRAIRGMPEPKMRNGRIEIDRREFTDDERTRLFVQSIGSSLAMAGIYALAIGAGGDDDKEPWFTVTATGPSDFGKREQLRATGWREHSLKFGDVWIPYKDSPLLVPLAIVGNFVDARRYQKSRDDLTFQSRALDSIMRGTRVLFDTSMLSGLGTLMDFVQDRASAHRISQFLTRIPADLVVPYSNLLRQVDRAFSPEAHTADGPLGNAGAALPFVRNTGSVRVDVLGESVKSSPLDRFASFETDDAVRELLRAKNVFVPTPDRNTKLGDGVMTPEQFAEFQRVRGARLKRELEIRVPMMRPMPREQVERIVQRLAREATEDAKENVRRLSPLGTAGQ